MIFDVINGSFGKGFGHLFPSEFRLPKRSGWGKISVSTSKIAEVELASEENVKRLAGTLGWGAVGGFVLGPVGMLAGLLLGGKKSRCGFIVRFDDGRAFLATGDHETWLAIRGASLTARPLPNINGVGVNPSAAPLDNLVGSEAVKMEPVAALESALLRNGWDSRRLPKDGAERFVIFQGNKGGRSLSLVLPSDAVTDYSLDQMSRALERHGCATDIIVISASVGRSVARRARELKITVTELARLEAMLR